MPDPDASLVHISSAVVRCLPQKVDAVLMGIDALPGAEVAHHEGGKLIVVIEGSSSGAVGDCLARISAMEGVVSSAMVYEQIETMETLGEEA